ncbi:DUF421 domain-containing protein [Xylanibacillus composti]|uniref:YetF C-terminal domain-containing protein n=1 Tax=Xylanibacillus composti TaxID=1572762 RepID=A0A8J4H508_9BACL|nr:DUF421 domain-containing protein [Xylanibacillus composti]MDT9724484.1 DUF421 domain-containing protein [Xylanibacillus composti]GIQ69746.1 hypothetical protein XYCOK13_25700 [Xylanibacillus composti]
MPQWLEVALRTFSALVVLFIITRFILGKRQITQLTYFEYITGITIGSIAAFISLHPDQNWMYGLVALLVWAIVMAGIEYFSLKSKRLRSLVEGKGTVLIKDGKIMEENMAKVRYTSEDLLEQLRKKNAFQAADVEFAVLETSGDLSVLMKPNKQPITPAHLGLRLPNQVEPQAVIMDGELITEGLATLGLSPGWLKTELDKQGILQENVYLAQANQYGELYVDLYDDQLKVPSPSARPLLQATLKKCQADLELFALSTQDQKAKNLYANCADQMRQVMEDMEPLLTTS